MTGHMAQQSSKRCEKYTFLQIHGNLILVTTFEHHSQSLYMEFYEPKYYLIIEVDFKKFVYKIFKGSYYNSGKNRRSILKYKGHYHILETSPLCCKSSLVSVFLCNLDMMVLENPSVNDYISCPPILSSISSINRIVNGSYKKE